MLPLSASSRTWSGPRRRETSAFLSTVDLRDLKLSKHGPKPFDPQEDPPVSGFWVGSYPKKDHVLVKVEGDANVHVVDLREQREEKELGFRVGADSVTVHMDPSGKYAVVYARGAMVELWSVQADGEARRSLGPIGPVTQSGEVVVDLRLRQRGPSTPRCHRGPPATPRTGQVLEVGPARRLGGLLKPVELRCAVRVALLQQPQQLSALKRAHAVVDARADRGFTSVRIFEATLSKVENPGSSSPASTTSSSAMLIRSAGRFFAAAS
ncbi:hypothetical protein [Streptomyces sp. 5-6(2022)]|uniref:hypothetical protein n=1 Tax=Streptomyces sp. 5-6(2022) TaxID=2936510 RepID=UPI0023B8AB24|nr:hypothetical protein [Streptomyces sp. 5-6(2022)]